MSNYRRPSYPIRDIYSHLEVPSNTSSELGCGSCVSRPGLEDFEQLTWPLTPPSRPSPNGSRGSTPLLSASPLELGSDLFGEDGMQDYFSERPKRPSGGRTQSLPESFGPVFAAASTSPPLRAAARMPLSPRPRSIPSSPESRAHSPSEHSHLPRLVTQLDSRRSYPETFTSDVNGWKYMYHPVVKGDGTSLFPAGEAHLSSKWSPDSTTMSDDSSYFPPLRHQGSSQQQPLRRSCSRLESHLSFVAGVSPHAVGAISSDDAFEGEAGSGIRDEVLSREDTSSRRPLGGGDGCDSGVFLEGREGILRGNVLVEEASAPISSSSPPRKRDIANTLSAYAHHLSRGDEYKGDSLEGSSSYDTESTLELDTADEEDEEFSRGNSRAGVELAPPGLDFGLSNRMKYTHGHVLQRMPGKVKGFGPVPHYHHRVHGSVSTSELELGSRRSRSEGDEWGEDVVGRGRGGNDGSGGDRELYPQLRDEDNSRLAFLNLNMTETGRDIRVLVRSKQTKINDLGGSLDDFEDIIEELIVEEPMLFEDTDDQYHRKLIMHPRECPKFMIKRLPLSSSELLVLLELNHSDIRNAAWNPVPHVICAVDRRRTTELSERDVDDSVGKEDDDVFLFFEPLQEAKNNPWLQSVGDYLDCFKELLEGLTFLHEHRIAGMRCSLARSFMRTSEPSAPHGNVHRQVRYKFVDFADAQRVFAPQFPRGSPDVDDGLVRRDVQDLSCVFRRILDQRIPQVRTWFTPLVEAMSRGGLTADEARRSLEELRKDLEVIADEGEDDETPMAGVMKSRAKPERTSPSPRRPLGSDSEDDEHPRLYYKSEEDSDQNDVEELVGGWSRGRSGTITAKVAIPSLRNVPKN